MLIRRGADRTLADGEGKTAMDYAAASGFPALEEVLKSKDGG
jgi:ankyrin repeat protein